MSLHRLVTHVMIYLGMITWVQIIQFHSGYAITDKEATRQAIEKCEFSFSAPTDDQINCTMRHLLKTNSAMVYREAELGKVWYQFWLGKAYERGDWGVPLDYTESMRWYRKAANQGVAAAQKEMGDFYYFAHGVAKSYRDAFTWYQLAAEQGEGAAQGILGMMYEAGQGVPQDFVQAHMWYNLAAANGDKNFDEVREIFSMSRDTLAIQMTPDQIAEAQTLVRNWKPKKGIKYSDEQWLGKDIR